MATELDLPFSIPKPEYSVQTNRRCDSVLVNKFSSQTLLSETFMPNEISSRVLTFCLFCCFRTFKSRYLFRFAKNQERPMRKGSKKQRNCVFW